MSQKYPNLFLEGNANGLFKAAGSRRITQEEIERQIYGHFLKHFTYAETGWRCIVKMNGKKSLTGVKNTYLSDRNHWV